MKYKYKCKENKRKNALNYLLENGMQLISV